MYPHERSLVQQYSNKHFKIVGVNSDPEGKLATLYANKIISWPCFYDGGSQMGPIATQWNVHGWPTVYLLDAHGKIRYLQDMERNLDEHIAILVNEAELEVSGKGPQGSAGASAAPGASESAGTVQGNSAAPAAVH